MVQEKIVTSSGQTDYLTFLYNGEGLTGFVLNSTVYTYRRNLFGDIIAIYQGNTKVAEYAYDAYGNCTIVFATGNAGILNPFRYRGYYYDSDIELYYLQSRYYDPETGRFINADDVSYLDPETIHGLNLYAYCLNNPVMYIDETGHFVDFILDIFFIGWDIYNLSSNDGWKDWKNWVALGVDIVFAVVPFVTGGGGQIVKLANVSDDISDFTDIRIVLNKAAMKALGYKRMEDAFVRSSTPLVAGIKDGKPYEKGMSMMPVVAVVDDFFPGHLTEGIKPLCFVVGYSSQNGSVFLSVKEGKERELISYLRRMEQEIYNTDEFEYSWMADEVAALYAHDRKVAAVYSVFAFIAIVVSCLGLFGISLFDIRQRYREIAIRKVNGARLTDLYRLLFSRYLKVLAASFVVAAPLGWYIIYRYTEGFAVKAPVDAWIFVVAFLLVMLISLGTLLWQVGKAARINPADVMKRE